DLDPALARLARAELERIRLARGLARREGLEAHGRLPLERDAVVAERERRDGVEEAPDARRERAVEAARVERGDDLDGSLADARFEGREVEPGVPQVSEREAPGLADRALAAGHADVGPV